MKLISNETWKELLKLRRQSDERWKAYKKHFEKELEKERSYMGECLQRHQMMRLEGDDYLRKDIDELREKLDEKRDIITKLHKDIDKLQKIKRWRKR